MKKIILTIVLVISLVLLIGVLIPKKYEVERSIDIYGSVEEIYSYVSDLTRWPEWTPWQNEDPTIRTDLGESVAGVGANQRWDGSSGDGYLLFTKSDKNSGVAYDLYYDNGLDISHCSIEFNVKKDSVNVVWKMTGHYKNSFFGGYKALFTDAMIGEMFSNGLKNLKSIVEKSNKL